MHEFLAMAEKTWFFRNAYRVNVHPGQEVRLDKMNASGSAVGLTASRCDTGRS